MTRFRFVAILAGLLLLATAVPVVSQTPTLEDRVTDLENRVAYLETFHPPSTTTTTPPQALVFDTDTTLTEPLVLNPGDTVELRNGARLMFGPGSYLDAQGTPTSTWTLNPDDTVTKNLTRDIRIFGAGDLMFMNGSLPSTIKFVEVDLQPLAEVDHYPLHWHFAGEGSRGTIVEGVVVKNSTNRCLVPHASHGITFQDVICDNIQNLAFWWNLPVSQSTDNNSNDITVDRLLVDTVVGEGALLGAGTGNSMTNSVVINADKPGGGIGAGYVWDGKVNQNPGGNTWHFDGNATINSELCIDIWLNDGNPHPIDNHRCVNSNKSNPSAGIYSVTMGAYNNVFAINNADIDGGIDSHAVGWSATGGDIGRLLIRKAQNPGTVTITNALVSEILLFNEVGTREAPITVTATNIGGGCELINILSVEPGTTVTIDGVACDLGA